jgi:hypothetical protein
LFFVYLGRIRCKTHGTGYVLDWRTTVFPISLNLGGKKGLAVGNLFQENRPAWKELKDMLVQIFCEVLVALCKVSIEMLL